LAVPLGEGARAEIAHTERAGFARAPHLASVGARTAANLHRPHHLSRSIVLRFGLALHRGVYRRYGHHARLDRTLPRLCGDGRILQWLTIGSENQPRMGRSTGGKPDRIARLEAPRQKQMAERAVAGWP